MEEFSTYLQRKDLSEKTIVAYQRHVNLFEAWLQRDVMSASKKDILNYFEYLQNEKGQQNITRRNAHIALNHYFSYLLQKGIITTNPTTIIDLHGIKRNSNSLYTVLFTYDELNTIYDDYYHSYIRNFDNSRIPKNQQEQNYLSRQRNYIMLGMLIYQGLHTNELQKITLADVDIHKGTVRIKAGKKSNERTLTLNVAQMRSLIEYMNTIRPQFFKYNKETEQFFFTLPESGKRKTTVGNLMYTIKPLTKQVKNINVKVENFLQIRTSVITNWLKTEGLMQTKYLAGHKYVSTTESYQSDNIDELSEDNTKYNPF